MRILYGRFQSRRERKHGPFLHGDGGGRGVGRALVEQLLKVADDNVVVAVELDPAALTRVDAHPAGPRVISVMGDASDEAVAERAADLAEEAGTLSEWVNNAAVFRDASVHSVPTRDLLDLIALNLNPPWWGVQPPSAAS